MDAVIDLARQLVACRSVTPDDGGSLALIASRLTPLGFVCERLDRGGVGNLWATHTAAGAPGAAVAGGTAGATVAPLICLAGHVDVVPPGPRDAWTSDPFAPEIRDGRLYGRGAADMKGSVAAMVVALERLVAADPRHPGTLALLLTADEEGDAVHGTAAVVETLRARGVTIDACILGEPTSTEGFGDTIKNGRRGSLNGVLRVFGVQCHIAYPERGSNPIASALPALAELAARQWDSGNEYFQPTSFQLSNIHAGTGATNVIPGTLEAQFNFRFSPVSTRQQLQAAVHDVLDRHGLAYTLDWTLSGPPFMTARGRLVDALAEAIAAVTRQSPALSTSGGTSDGRFLADIAREVVEFGPMNDTIHKVDECVGVSDLVQLTDIFERVVRRCQAG